MEGGGQFNGVQYNGTLMILRSILLCLFQYVCTVNNVIQSQLLVMYVTKSCSVVNA